MSAITNVSYNPKRETVTIDFFVDRINNTRDIDACDYFSACSIPEDSKKDAGSHTWQVAACYKRMCGTHKNRRIGYLPTEVARVLDSHTSLNQAYAMRDSWARWSVKKLTSGRSRTGRPYAKMRLELWCQNGQNFDRKWLEAVCVAFSINRTANTHLLDVAF